MKSLVIQPSGVRRALRGLAISSVAVAALACSSDDAVDETSAPSEMKANADQMQGSTGGSKAAADTQRTPKSSDGGAKASAPKPPTTNAAGSPAKSSDQTAGEQAVMRYDGSWNGKTSQGKPVSFKILNRFLAHIEIGYDVPDDADAGACDKSSGDAKVSAMLSLRGTAFMLTKETDELSLKVMANFPSDTSAEGTFEATLKGDCHAKVSGDWKANKAQ